MTREKRNPIPALHLKSEAFIINYCEISDFRTNISFHLELCQQLENKCDIIIRLTSHYSRNKNCSAIKSVTIAYDFELRKCIIIILDSAARGYFKLNRLLLFYKQLCFQQRSLNLLQRFATISIISSFISKHNTASCFNLICGSVVIVITNPLFGFVSSSYQKVLAHLLCCLLSISFNLIPLSERIGGTCRSETGQ